MSQKDLNVMISGTGSSIKNEDVQPIHALLGFVPNWFLLGTVKQKPHYASWSISSDAFDIAEGQTPEDIKRSKKTNPNRKPIRIQIVKTKFCTYVIER